MNKPRKSQSEVDASSGESDGRRKPRTEQPQLGVVYDDGAYTVVNKPFDCRMDGDFDITVQKMLLAKYPDRGMPKNVHQLDYATSGVMLWAYNRDAARCMAQAFEARTVSKAYLALVEVRCFDL